MSQSGSFAPPLHPMSSCNLPAHINDHLSISIYFSPQNLSGTIREDSLKANQLPCYIHNIKALDGEVSELTRAQRPSMLTSRPSEHTAFLPCSTLWSWPTAGVSGRQLNRPPASTHHQKSPDTAHAIMQQSQWGPFAFLATYRC